jgi:hypothetical protein
LIAQHSYCDLIQPRFINATFIQVRFGATSAQERAKKSSRRNYESSSESTEVQKPSRVIPCAAARNFPRCNLCFAWPIRFVLGCDVMQVVQTRRRYPRRPIGKIKWNRLGLEANPPIAIAAVWAELGFAKKQSAGGEQRQMVRISTHRSGQLTLARAN